jgi:hypothetical protein
VQASNQNIINLQPMQQQQQTFVSSVRTPSPLNLAAATSAFPLLNNNTSLAGVANGPANDTLRKRKRSE